jgi:hypothetical protein
MSATIWYSLTNLKSGCVTSKSDFSVRSKCRPVLVELTVVEHDINPAVLDVLDGRPNLFQIIPKDKLGLLRLTGRTELLQFLEVRVRQIDEERQVLAEIVIGLSCARIAVRDRKPVLTVAFPHKAACIISLKQSNPKDPRQIRRYT